MHAKKWTKINRKFLTICFLFASFDLPSTFAAYKAHVKNAIPAWKYEWKCLWSFRTVVLVYCSL